VTGVLADITVRFDVVAIGAMTGLGYAVLAAGLVLIYRSSRIINLAHGQIGAFAAVILVELGNKADLPYGLALPLAVAAGALVGLIVERTLVRPLATRSGLAVLVATIGVTQVLLVAQASMPDIIGGRYPTAVGWTRTVGDLVLHGEHFTLLLIGPVTLVAFAYLLTRTRYGLAIRAVADNRDASQLSGIDVTRVSRLVWASAGGLAAIAAILTSPLAGGGVGTAAAPALGPSLLLRAQAAGLVGRLTSVPRTIAAGLAIGILEGVLFASYPADLGMVDVVLFVAILGMLLVRSRTDADDGASLTFGSDPRPLARSIAQLPRVRAVRVGLFVAAGVAAVAAPFVQSSASDLFLLSQVPIFAIVGISVVVLTGWAGQLSLGQMAFVGFGALGTAALDSRGVPYGPAVAYVAFAGVVVALAVGAPALRLRGLFLTITTLGLAVAASSYLLRLEVFKSSSVGPSVMTPGKVGPLDFDSYRVEYYLCVAVLLGMILLARRIRSGGIGRSILAVEGNPRSVAAMTLSPAAIKLQSFAIAGAMATIAGGLFAGVNRTFQVESFGPEQSLQVLAMTVVGGIGSVAGAVLGAVYLIGVPQLFGDTSTVRLATSGIGLLVILRFEPGGLIAILERVRDRWIRTFVADHDAAPEPTAERAPIVFAEPAGSADGDHGGPPVLQLTEVSVELGGRSIVDRVDLEVGPGEIVGLIGSNGAGKTTLMNAISGFVPSSGRVELHGEELGGLPPHLRARLGLGRSFQTALLYPRLTTRECFLVALESRHRTELVPSLLALPPAVRGEARARRDADELLDLLGLGAYADRRVGVLSTGTRRIVELGCLLATQPSVILLDEPMAGIAQRETEAFGPLIVDLRRHLGAAVLIIEHDLPLVSAISDRMYCLETGAVIAEGTPDAVRANPRVVASYLGTDERAIARSGASATPARSPSGGRR
jgi:ABC-type branched-subunit amino acid transport system ATPase component/ABC-type branched-subunit amino acid transport system permease subunit